MVLLSSSFCSKEQHLYWSVNTSTNLFWFFDRQLSVLTCWARRIWSNFSWSKYDAALPLYLDFPLIEWWFGYATVWLVVSSPLPSLAAEIRDLFYWEVFVIVIILLCRPEVFSVYLKLRSTWLVLGASLWAQDSTLFVLYNLWHFYSSPLGLAQSRENESVEENLKSKMWMYLCAAVIQWGAKPCTRLFCVKQTLLLRTHLFSTFTNSVLLVLTFCTLNI